MQRDVLILVSKAITEYQVPLWFLIVSRPEFRIRTAFDAEPLVHLKQKISPSEYWDIYADIKAYLEDGFAKIYTNNFNVISSVHEPWSDPDIIHCLVLESSGQFIYASTVLKFVAASSDFTDPQSQLDILTQRCSTRSLVFVDLDNHYTNILSMYPRRESLVTVLGGLLAKLSPIWLTVCTLIRTYKVASP